MLSLFYEHQINEKVKKQVIKTMARTFYSYITKVLLHVVT